MISREMEAVVATKVSPDSYDVEVFFDADCPLCRREVDMIRWFDRKKRLKFTDISASDFDASRYARTLDDFMDQIYGRLPDGTWVRGVETFRRIYAAIGLRWLMPVTRLPGVSHGLEWGYRVFAKNRLRLTGRCRDGACVVSGLKK